jgi:sulfur-oxidizing protein SoxA
MIARHQPERPHMSKIVPFAAAFALLLGAPVVSQASPEEDLKVFREYFKERFPDVPFEDFANGVYSIDPISRDNWEAIEDFPPYEPFVEEGEEMWNTPFANGKTYADCFPDGPGQRQNYPHWDGKREMVVTLPLAINECREANGEAPLKYKKGPLASLLAYMSMESRGQRVEVEIPDEKALSAYESGKHFYYARRGQLNFSCANCHVQNAGMHLRADILSPAIGHATGWPVYRAKWGELGTLHRRFSGCNKQVRAKPFDAQSEEYRNLEYFVTYMSSGLQFNGPSARK